jgi:hypothetical protein
MCENMRKFSIIIGVFFVLAASVAGASAAAQGEDTICMYYFTGIGCPHCANVDPVIFGDWLEDYPDLIVVEYELYTHTENVPVFQLFVLENGMKKAVPNLLMGYNGSVSGDTPILNALPLAMQQRANITAEYGDVFFTLDHCPFAALTGSPQIWHDDRILIKTGPDEADDAFLKDLLLTDDLHTALKGADYEEVEPFPVNFSGGAAEFEHAIQTGNWTLQWNGEELRPPETETKSTPLSLALGIAAICTSAMARRRE